MDEKKKYNLMSFIIIGMGLWLIIGQFIGTKPFGTIGVIKIIVGTLGIASGIWRLYKVKKQP